jgi:hypothetical protein
MLCKFAIALLVFPSAVTAQTDASLFLICRGTSRQIIHVEATSAANFLKGGERALDPERLTQGGKKAK